MYNYTVFSQITVYWVKFYLNSRNSVLFYHNLNVFNGYFNTISSNLLKKYLLTNSDLLNGYGFSLMNTTFKVNFLSRLSSVSSFKSLNYLLITNFSKNSLSSGMYIKSKNTTPKPNKLEVYLTSFSDNDLYTNPSFLKNELLVKSNLHRDLKTNTYLYQTLVTIYQINIYLTLLNTNHNL